MCWEIYCFSLFVLLGQFTGGNSLRLNLTTNSPYGQNGSVVFYLREFTARLTCTVEDVEEGNEANYSIAWYYNNVPIDSAMDGSLVMAGIDISDGGWYTCAISNNTQRFELDFLLVVGESPLIERGADMPSYVVQAGTRVEFSCFPRGTPHPEVKWFIGGDEIIDGAEDGLYRIDPTSQSLVIFNTTEELLNAFRCVASNRFGREARPQNPDVAASISMTPLPSVLVTSNANFTDGNQLLVTVDQSDNDTTLDCADGFVGDGFINIRFRWFRNGNETMISRQEHTLTISRDMDGSGFYCCEIFNRTSQVTFNVHCATVIFRSRPTFIKPTLPRDTEFRLPPGRRAALICHGVTDLPPRPNYDPPNLTWSSSGVSEDMFESKVSDGPGLAYSVVTVEPGSSGTYLCSGNNFVNSVKREVELVYVDVGEYGGLIRNGLAEGQENAWVARGSAGIATYMKERVFMLTFSNPQSIENIWLSQEFTVPGEYQAFSIRGRIRHSANFREVLAVIQVFRGDETLSLVEIPHPVRDSTAWQWVQMSASNSGTTNYTIRLALKTDDGTVSKRQGDGNGGNVFFDDIDVTPTNREEPSDSDDGNRLAYIIGGTVGGASLLVLVVIIVCVVCFCCCRKGKDNARPMRKLTTLVKKKVSTRHYKSRQDKNRHKMDSPTPIEYEIPVLSGAGDPSIDSAAYATLQGHYRGTSSDGKNEYTALNRKSLDEPSYYTHTTTSTFKNPGKKGEGGGEDVGGVNMYLEVVPPLPSLKSHPGSPRGSSPVGLTVLKDAKAKAKEENDVLSPDVLDGDSVDPMYEYVNADLGPA